MKEVLQELVQIRKGISSLLELLRAEKQIMADVRATASAVAATVDGFTSGGAPFRAYQVDPVTLLYASILGPVLGDRLDGQVAKGACYEEDMMRGAVPLAVNLLRELDAYRTQAGGRSYLEHVAGDIHDPGAAEEPPEPPTILPH
jgi:hypothetical protein